MDPQELLMTAARGLGAYAFMLLIIRVLGKRTVGNFTAFDLLVALMLGEVVDEIIYGDVDVAQGAIAILVVAGAKYLTAWFTYLGMNRVFEGTPTIVVEDGKLNRRNLRKEIMSDKEVFASLRLHGVDDMREVKLATLEVDGLVSVIKHDWAEPVQKGDVVAKAKKEKKETAGEEEEPPEDRQTDSPRALGYQS